MYKTILIYADNIFSGRPVNNEPHMAVINSLLESRGYDCESIYNTNPALVEERINSQQVDYLGICMNFSPKIIDVVTFCQQMKKAQENIQIILYGLYANCDNDYLLSNFSRVFNFIIKGEPEFLFLDIVEKGSQSPTCKIISKSDTICLKSTKLPTPKKNLKNELNTLLSRGCVMNCLFCEEKYFYHNFSIREISDVIKELENHISTSDKNKDCWVFFSDLDFLSITALNPNYIKDLVEGCIKEKIKFKFTIQTRADRISPNIENLNLLKKIGLQAVSLGIESGSDEILIRYNKKTKGVNVNIEAIETLKKLGILYKINFIMYDPLTSLNNIKQNLMFFKNIDFPLGSIPSHPPVSFSDKLKFFYGTECFEYYKKQNVKYEIRDYSIYYDFLDLDVQLYYQYIVHWREQISKMMRDFYKILNHMLYNNMEASDSLKVQHIGMVIKKTDLEFMMSLVDGVQKNMSLDDILQKYVTEINNNIDKRIYKLTNKYEVDKYNFRGWHGQLNIILNEEDAINA